MNQRIAQVYAALPGVRACLATACLGLMLAACQKPIPPRSFAEFMDDQIAREGTIAYCNEHPDEARANIECANARRAATTIALRAERERREELERESERKLDALRTEMAERERIVRESTLAAARAEREAYENLWRNRTGTELFGSGDNNEGPQPQDDSASIASPNGFASPPVDLAETRAE